MHLRSFVKGSVALARLLGLAVRRDAFGARILMFHGTPLRKAKILERQLSYLARNFDIVALESLVRSPQGRKLALTFDDGLRNNVTVLYPILKKLGIPATFFVCPGLIERRRWLWNHEARQRLLSMDEEALAELAVEVGAPAGVEPFVGWMKTLDPRARSRVERKLREATPGYTPSPEEREGFDLADWSELRQLDPQVVTIGSHGMTHAILTAIEPQQVEAEIRDSRCMIEKRLARPAEVFCYPNGNVDAVALDCARKHYRAAVTDTKGAVVAGCDP
ncbi:MAG: polysaccharide deacetylase family protein, partial [Pseudomonadota bacterium]|nr:polysaccharide deacetylase family protein [Pseudomonadota bacterium]